MPGKKLSIGIIAALLLMHLPLSAQESNKVDYNARLVEVLEGYQNLMAIELDQDVEDILVPAWNIVSLAIEKGFLRFTVNPENLGLLKSAHFNAVPRKDVTHIIVSKDLLDLWPIFPATVYAVMSSVFQEAANFFQNPPVWAAIQLDKLEHLLLKVERYSAQAQMLENRLQNSEYTLSNFDSYILDSYTKDGLASVILFLERHSLPVAQGLYQARLNFEESRDEDFLRDTILNLGEGMLKNRNQLPANAEDMNVYPLAVAINSWLDFTPEMIARIHNRNRSSNPLGFTEILGIEEDYDNLRRRLEISKKKDMPLIRKVAEDISTNFIITKP